MSGWEVGGSLGAMAIVVPGRSECSICGEVLRGSDLRCTIPRFSGPEQRWGKYSGAAVHWGCYANWKHREQYVAALIPAVQDVEPGWGNALAYAGEHCTVVACFLLAESSTPFDDLGPAMAVMIHNPTLRVWLHGVGLPLTTSLNDWDNWVSEKRDFDDELMQSSWDESISELRSLSKAQLMKDVDGPAVVDAWNAKVQKIFEDSRVDRLQAQANLREHNQTLHTILQSRPPCPHCGGDFESLKYYDNRANPRKSCVICQSCARSSRVEEFRGEIGF